MSLHTLHTLFTLYIMKNEDIDEKSLSKFFSYYNNYIYGVISGYWPLEKRRNFKKLINVNSTTTESNTDL